MNIEELIEKVAKGEIKLHQVEKHTNDKRLATEIRRKALERKLGITLDNIGHYSIDPNQVISKNIENMIGVVQIPMGVAGPLKINGEYAKGDFYIPLATTEGALVASVNRGCSTLTAAGGVKTTIIGDKMTRAPLLKCPDARKAREVAEWVKGNIEYLQEEAVSKVTRHGKLRNIKPYIVGNNLYLRFEFETGDAMGMNMVTIASEELMKVIESRFPEVKYLALSGNVCVDKKPNAMNFINGRGKSVIAEAIIPREIVEKKLKTTPELIAEVNYRKNLVGSAQAGSYGFNAHFGNIVGAIFLATGQDEAQITEGSHGITLAEVTPKGDLYISITMPSLEIGTVGGGTRVPTQREALTIMGVAGGGEPPGTNAKKFAEIIAGAVLAGELSLLAAIAAKHLAKAHKELGR
ncbi:hydroxymethylglutaryl-CoA reductase (NADPH) [Thermococcus argininiproducens]|uniref:3-hydroxy-3-methylglutaryl coenzyme A reductase n=1 Tax=Thermococcus argininiproducens TaxID=2866384 RepID=A0A9E7SBQ7_9EURY|nr:hydroxymethylglutaryl-CoA reductase (NADPH) [Thermococcus argininiproducens]USG99124.1 hydroxymethylglutaryl-CoA reductase (NADPH) [Thermococcus argininiproducens]